MQEASESSEMEPSLMFQELNLEQDDDDIADSDYNYSHDPDAKRPLRSGLKRLNEEMAQSSDAA